MYVGHWKLILTHKQCNYALLGKTLLSADGDRSISFLCNSNQGVFYTIIGMSSVSQYRGLI